MRIQRSGRKSNAASGAAALVLAGGVLLAKELLKRRRRYDLRDKTVVITGGSRGLGLVLAREFGKRGARLAICARDQQELDRAVEDLRSRGFEAYGFQCDLTDQQRVETVLNEVRQRFGDIDVLVNNAGTIAVGPIDSVTLDDYRESLDIHLWGPVYTTMAVLPDMRRRGHGRIVNISSIGGKISVPHLVPYSVGKFALAGFSEGLHAEILKDGVHVTTVYPGLMRTGSPRNATFKGKHRAEYAWFSVSDALPLLSISAERAARGIVSACEKGRARLILSTPAKAAVKMNEVFPETMSSLLSLASRLLPGPGGIGKEKALGRESFSPVSPSILTLLDERAARNNNQVA